MWGAIYLGGGLAPPNFPNVRGRGAYVFVIQSRVRPTGGPSINWVFSLKCSSKIRTSASQMSKKGREKSKRTGRTKNASPIRKTIKTSITPMISKTSPFPKKNPAQKPGVLLKVPRPHKPKQRQKSSYCADVIYPKEAPANYLAQSR